MSFKGCLTPLSLPNIGFVPCGKCVNCLAADQKAWVCRMVAESLVRPRPLFVTLTFSDEYLPENGCVSKRELRSFLHSLRVRLNRLCDGYGVDRIKLSYFAVGEYGRQYNRPHYHLMMYGWPLFMSVAQVHDEIAMNWPKGFVKVESFCLRVVNYIAKYMTKLDPRPHEVKPFRIMSLKPALGKTYFDTEAWRIYFNQPNVRLSVNLLGRWYVLPRYFEFLLNDEKIEEIRSSREKWKMNAMEWRFTHPREFYFDLDERGKYNKRMMKKILDKFC